MLDNKLGINNSTDLAREEERISKKKAVELFENNILDILEVGKFSTLQTIHKYLFEDIYDFAGKLRNVNIAKGNFRFASIIYIEEALKNIDKMPQSNFDEIIEKYVEMNVAHPFREGNGRTQRVFWSLCAMEAGYDLDWTSVSSRDMDSASKIARLNDDLTALKAIFKEIAIPFNKNSSLPIDAVYKRLLRVRNHLSMQADRTYDLTEKYIR